MRTSIALDTELLNLVKKLAGVRTKQAAVEVAMRTYVEAKTAERRAPGYAERARRLEERLREVRLGESARDLLRADRDQR